MSSHHFHTYTLGMGTQNNFETNSEEIRLFPLGLVLLPSAPLSLRIFEKRYKLMISECLDYGYNFGVLLIKTGAEVGGGAKPHSVGTLARIVDWNRQNNGNYHIYAQGTKRFRLEQITQEKPYMMGKISYIYDVQENIDGQLLSNCRELMRELDSLVSNITGEWESSQNVITNPTDLSYAIAASVGRPPLVAQYLLQIPTTQERLERSLPILQEQINLIRTKLAKNPGFQRYNLN
ncbi:MAG: hypothetical protein CL891_01920 [Dehalococcoidia bacterium]|nr:hypothetical protein [Dehalococcoidia bacterium]